MIGEHEPDHGFDNGHGTRDDARIVASARGEFGIFAGSGDGLLRAGDGGQPPFPRPPVRPLALSTAFTPKANS